jgi:hypothetical protein
MNFFYDPIVCEEHNKSIKIKNISLDDLIKTETLKSKKQLLNQDIILKYK